MLSCPLKTKIFVSMMQISKLIDQINTERPKADSEVIVLNENDADSQHKAEMSHLTRLPWNTKTAITTLSWTCGVNYFLTYWKVLTIAIVEFYKCIDLFSRAALQTQCNQAHK